MPFATASISAIAALAATKIVDQVAGSASGGFVSTVTRMLARRRRKSQQHRQVEEAINAHLVEILKWSETVQIFGMSAGVSTDVSTAQLDVAEVPRRFRPREGRYHRLLKEEDLLRGDKSYFLLGDPGAGKTTALKHLVRTVLQERPRSIGGPRRTPILVVLRNQPYATSIVEVVLRSLGLDELADTHFGHLKGGDSTISSQRADRTLYRLTASILDSCNAVLLLDGLDEVHRSVRDDVDSSLERLAEVLVSSKIVVSCRSGDYTRSFDSFNVVEMCPLQTAQIQDIVVRWLGEPLGRSFLREISGDVAAAELANRPLFLSQMMLLFKNMMSIPDKPSDLCRQIVRLMLQDWDQQRGIARRSKYSRFDIDTRAQFLSSMAYVLTFDNQSTHFNRSELVQAYGAVCRRFRLPANEAETVARELETHTGIIVAAGFQEYEFSHRSLQEYLAAEHVVRLASLDDLGDMFTAAPEVLAVAVALSSSPSKLMYDMFGALMRSGALLRASQHVDSFVSRLIQESPALDAGDYLGLAASYIVQACSSDREFMYRFVEYPEVAASVVGVADPDVLPHGLKLRRGFDRDEIVSVAMPSKGLGLGLISNCPVQLFDGYWGEVENHARARKEYAELRPRERK